jgi:hypothetical protein
VAVSGLMLQAANLGGKIAHEELRGSMPATEEGAGGDEEGEEAEAGEGGEDG